MPTRTILVIDDEPNMRWVLGRALEQAGYTASAAASGAEALRLLAEVPIDLALLDLKLKGEDGLTVLRRIRERAPEVIVLMFTAYGTVPTAVEAMQLGAADFLRKPFDVEEVLFKIARALERRAMQQELIRLTAVQRCGPAFDALVGAAPAWQQALAQARQAAALADDMLITGEPGSGRRTLARAIHAASGRTAAPLVEHDPALFVGEAQAAALCGPGGAWDAAGSGTFLVWGVDTTPAAQAALAARLRGRERPGGPRLLLVAGDDPPLAPELLSLLPLRLHVPPLRERPGDALLFAMAWLEGRGLAPAARAALDAYRWPGNVPEVRAAVTRARQLAGDGPIELAHLPVAVQGALAHDSGYLVRLPPEGVSLEVVEQDLIRQALARTHGNRSRAAELLGLTRHTLLYRMEKYGIVAAGADTREHRSTGAPPAGRGDGAERVHGC
jgi:two-component system NtrC family response regulator